jgi:hypothetical protein
MPVSQPAPHRRDGLVQLAVSARMPST